jgi:WhiB family redox-sensing transcriptional regulator
MEVRWYQYAPIPSGDVQSWRDEAVCAQIGSDLWFPEKGGSARRAKEICETCPVRVECLEYALAQDEQFGVFGGMSRKERVEYAKKRRAGEAA